MILYTSSDFEGLPDKLSAVSRDTPVVLLSDSHWYWWYVRIISTGSEQFVPADIVEFPQERLARSNMVANEWIPMVGVPKLSKKPSTNKKSVRFAPEPFYQPDVPELTSDSDSDISLPSSPVAEVYTDAAVATPQKAASQKALEHHIRIHDVASDIGVC